MRGLRAASLLVVPGLVLQVVSTASASAADSAPSEAAPLAVTLSAAGTVARTYDWSLQKVADAPIRSTGVDGTATFRYTVTASAGAMTESGWTLGGNVTVTNSGTSQDGPITADVTVTTTLGGGSACSVTGGVDAVIPPSGELTLPYRCSFSSTPGGSGTVDATVTWDPAGEASVASVGASAPGSFAVTSETNRTVAVVDDQTVAGQRVVLDPALAWSAGLVQTYSYDLRHAGGPPAPTRAPASPSRPVCRRSCRPRRSAEPRGRSRPAARAPYGRG